MQLYSPQIFRNNAVNEYPALFELRGKPTAPMLCQSARDWFEEVRGKGDLRTSAHDVQQLYWGQKREEGPSWGGRPVRPVADWR